MAEPEEIDEDLFADLYDGDETTKEAEPATALQPEPEPITDGPANGQASWHDEPMSTANEESGNTSHSQDKQPDEPDKTSGPGQDAQNNEIVGSNGLGETLAGNESHGIGIKEDGKMFIGGLNWETTDQSLKDYFSRFGEVQECTVMRDSASGRSRGFGFLTFKDPRTVNIVMVKEHHLDGKIIDPKRAIPRDEQERTSKIFVGGVSQEATEQDFKEYFMQYGRVVDATLMMDKDSGRPRGFGFVTFDSEAAVDATLQGDLTILGKSIEVKKAQPRGNVREEEERDRRGRRGGRDDRFRDDHANTGNQNQLSGQTGQASATNMSPQMAAQYWQRMQQFMAQFMANSMGMNGMNPAMLQMKQLQAMQQMQAMQMQQMQVGQQQGSQSPNQQGSGMQGAQGMTPQMLQQMQLQMAAGQGQQGATGGGNLDNSMGAVPTGPAMGGGGGGRRGTPGYDAQEQLMFEQQKYEQQQARRGGHDQHMPYQQGGPTSWEGMYDDVPQPNPGHGGGGRGGGHGPYNRGGGHGGSRPQPPKGPQPSAPANAPTGPKNQGVPGANYRGGGRGGHRGNYHPYRRGH